MPDDPEFQFTDPVALWKVPVEATPFSQLAVQLVALTFVAKHVTSLNEEHPLNIA